MNAAHKDHERYILEGFCLAYAQQFQAPCKLIDVRDSPDGIVKIDGILAGVELARYREQGPRNNAQERDSRLLQFLHDEWMRNSSIQNYSTTLVYRTSATGEYQIPSTRSDEAARFFDDLKRLILQPPTQAPDSFETFSFHSKSDVSRYERYQRNARLHHFAEEDFPNLSRFCTQVRIQFHPRCLMLCQRSSLNTFYTSFDIDEIEKLLLNKLDKVTRYRSNIPAKQRLWLLIYSEGWNPTGRVHVKDQLNTAHELIRKIAAEKNHGFDAIWWADEVEQPSGGRLMQMYP